MNKQNSNVVSDIELFKHLWYARNPIHETNLDSGEDMFWSTAELVAREYVSDLHLRVNTIEPINDEELYNKMESAICDG